MAVPTSQHDHCGTVAPTNRAMSNRPSPRCATTKDASTSAWAWSAREARLPCRLSLRATPMTR